MLKQTDMRHLESASANRSASFFLLALHLFLAIGILVYSQSSLAAPSPHPIRINQLGYYPNATKYGFIETNQPLENILGNGNFYFAVLYDAPGAPVEVYRSPILTAKQLANHEGGGCDTPCVNSSTGTYLYQWDFSPATKEHNKLKVVIRKTATVAGVQPSTVMTSPEFPVGWNTVMQSYRSVANSAFKYYYFHRIGEATTTTYLKTSEGFNPAHAHAAFHVDANNKPEGVPCFDDWCGNGVMESGDIKVGAGTAWADAGDFGVYPVNHAMAAWQLLNLVEFPTQSWVITAAIPQGSSGWYEKVDPTETSGKTRRFLVATEVEAGSQFMRDFDKLPGIYPHKIHNQSWGEGFAAWTPQLEIDVVPATNSNAGGGNTDYKRRSATRPSTASTWAVCRTAFHLARVMKIFGKTSQANSWLSTGVKAWSRAHKENNVLYPAAYATNPEDKLSIGGGPYGDRDITDDHYACMVEAYLAYYAINRDNGNFTLARNTLMGSTHYKAIDLKFDWQKVRTQANMSLLVAANDLPSADIEQIKKNLEYKARDAYDYVVGNESDGWSDDGKPAVQFSDYGNPAGDFTEQWGSNPTLLNMGVLLSYAAKYQHSNSRYTSEQYAKAALKTLDYIFGENAQNISFVTGYGKYAEEDTHDRIAWWAKNKHSSKAPYPKGWLAGGPMGNWSSCLAGDETKWNGDRSYETGSIFWKDSSGKPYNLDQAWQDGFTNSAGVTISGEDLTAQLSNSVLRGSSPSTSYYPIERGSTIPSLKVYGAIGTSADAWCTKENTVNYNSALLWMTVAGDKFLRWQID